MRRKGKLGTGGKGGWGSRMEREVVPEGVG